MGLCEDGPLSAWAPVRTVPLRQGEARVGVRWTSSLSLLCQGALLSDRSSAPGAVVLEEKALCGCRPVVELRSPGIPSGVLGHLCGQAVGVSWERPWSLGLCGWGGAAGQCGAGGGSAAPRAVCGVDWLRGGEPRGAREGWCRSSGGGRRALRLDGARGTRGGCANTYTSPEDFL